jgi:hypothetical protein
VPASHTTALPLLLAPPSVCPPLSGVRRIKGFGWGAYQFGEALIQESVVDTLQCGPCAASTWLEQTTAISDRILSALRDKERKEFRDLLCGIVKRHSLRGIAEEMSQRGLGISPCSVGFQLAKDLGLHHQYCDPEPETRKARCIQSDAHRESYWLEQLQNFHGFPALFILGSNHVEGFKSLLTEAGIRAVVEQRDWTPPH